MYGSYLYQEDEQDSQNSQNRDEESNADVGGIANVGKNIGGEKIGGESGGGSGPGVVRFQSSNQFNVDMERSKNDALLFGCASCNSLSVAGNGSLTGHPVEKETLRSVGWNLSFGASATMETEGNSGNSELRVHNV